MLCVGVTVPTERMIRDGYESTSPRTTDEILARYEASDTRKRMQTEYNYPDTEEAKKSTIEFKRTVRSEKHPSVLTNHWPVTVGFRTQLNASVQRQYQILRGDKTVLLIKQGTNLIQAFLSGSLFYNAPNTSTGIFIKSGAIFVALLFNCLVAQSEVTDSFFGRPVLAKHRRFALHHPAAWCLAQIITDIPIILFQVSVFSVVIYFLVGLRSSAEAFFTFWFIILSATVCLTAFFRAVGAGFKTFNDASKFSGVSVTAVLLYIGYMIPKYEMRPWFVW